jgi:hypothetical protein
MRFSLAGQRSTGSPNVAAPVLPAPLPGDELLTQREAAALLKVCVAYLRASSCPKLLLPGSGPRGKPVLRYLRSDVLSWALARRT